MKKRETCNVARPKIESRILTSSIEYKEFATAMFLIGLILAITAGVMLFGAWPTCLAVGIFIIHTSMR